MPSYFYPNQIGPNEDGLTIFIYLEIRSNNPLYKDITIRNACNLLLIDDIDIEERRFIMPLTYVKRNKLSSSPLVKISIHSKKAATINQPAVSKTFNVLACKANTSLLNLCTTILRLKKFKLGEEIWDIIRVTAVDQMKIDLRN